MPVTPGTSATQTGSPPASSGAYTLRWIVAWAAALVLLSLLVRTRAGYAAAYYLAVLMLLFLVLSQYRAIVAIFQPITG